MENNTAQPKQPQTELNKQTSQPVSEAPRPEITQKQPVETTPQSKKKKWVLPVLVIISILFLGAVGYFGYQGYVLEKNEQIISPEHYLVEVKPTTDVNVPTSTGEATGSASIKYSISLPQNMDQVKKACNISLKSLTGYREMYQKAKEEGGCPGPCSTLIEDNNLELQFDILKKFSNLTNCQITEELKNDIDSFILFDRGIGIKGKTDVVYNNNLKTCGLIFVGYDGYDTSLDNYEYEAGFLYKDYIIRINCKLYPEGVFAEVDQILKDIGLTEETNDSYDSEKEFEFMENIDYESPLNQKIINTYKELAEAFSVVSQ